MHLCTLHSLDFDEEIDMLGIGYKDWNQGNRLLAPQIKPADPSFLRLTQVHRMLDLEFGPGAVVYNLDGN